MIRKITYLLSFFFIIQNHLFSYSSNPKDFVNELVNDAIEKLSDKSLTDEKKTNFIKELALENVDINALGLYTRGELRKSASKEDISNYQKSFSIF